MNGGNGLRGCWLTALVLLTLVALVASHLMLLLLHSNYPDEQKKTVQKRPVRVRSSSPLSLSESPKFWQIDDAPEDTSVLQEPTTTSSSSDGLAESSIVATKDDPASQYSDTDDPFSPPLYGYDSMSELQGRGNRFPTIQQRVQVYMSNWYLPPCKKGSYSTRDEDAEDGLVHYRRVITPSSNHQSLVLVQEVTSAATPVPYPRTFLLDSNSTLGKLHFVSRDKMHPDMCDSEYCEDILQHWIPAMDRVVVLDDRQNHPVFFQFSDEELSRAYSILYQDLEKYPNLPHLKKSRLSLLSHTGSTSDTAHCSSIPRPILPTMTADADIPAHLHPSTCAVLPRTRHLAAKESPLTHVV